MTAVHEQAGPPAPAPTTTLEVEYRGEEATLRMTTDPDDVDAGARLLCAALGHLRRRRTRRVHTVLDLGTPASVVLLEALRDRVGTDVDGIVLRRAGSSVMVTLELCPVTPAVAPVRPTPGGRTRAHAPRTVRATRPRTSRAVLA